jgi:hypothetical protein
MVLEVSMADDKGFDVGYVADIVTSVENDLMEMERALEPVLSQLLLGQDPHGKWGNRVSQRVRDAAECKQRAWARITELIERLGDHTRDSEQAPRLTRSDSNRTAGQGKAVKLLITLVED